MAPSARDTIAIRPAVRTDCAFVYDLICDMENEELPYDEFTRIFAEQMVDGRMLCLVAEEDGERMGFINLRMERQLHHAARIAEVMELVVIAGHRSQGVGAKLIEAACGAARTAGCIQIEVACKQHRSRAHAFYERQGFESTHFKFCREL